MKYSIMQEIYYGNRGHCESIKVSGASRQLNEECLELYENLRKTLNEEQKELLEDLLNKDMDAEAETALTHYKEGLKIGLLLFSECLQD